MQPTSEQIQLLLIEKITGTIDAEDDRTIEQLLADDAEVRQQWQTMQQQVQQSAAQGFSIEVDEEQRWEAIKPHLKRHSKAKVIPFVRIAMAAAVLAAVVAGIFLFTERQSPVPTIAHAPASVTPTKKQSGITLSTDDGKTIALNNATLNTFQLGTATIKADADKLSYSSSPTDTQQWSTLFVPAALDYKVMLADGTEVWLNAETRLRFPLSFSGKTREVYMDGEAYFKVAKNKQRPFIVHTPKTNILVTGTQFNVNTYNADKIKTALVEGSVIARGSGNIEVDLKPGFEVVYNPQEGFRTKAFDENKVLSWMKGEYYFHNTPLQHLAKVLSRWYNVEVQFENEALKSKTFSGELLKRQSLQLFLDNLQVSAEVHSYIKDGIVYFQ